MRLLTALAERRRPQMLKTLAAAAGMAPAKAHRYMVSFMRAGYVDREPESGLYRLGPASLHLGLSAIGGTDAIRLGTQAICELRDEINQTMAMMVWGQLRPDHRADRGGPPSPSASIRGPVRSSRSWHRLPVRFSRRSCPTI